jgi:hypothetical protein
MPIGRVPLRDYCIGLLTAEGRKSVEPMAAVTAPSRVSAQQVVGDPADIGPCVRRPGADCGRVAVVGKGIVEIPRHDARSEAEAASGFDQQHGEIAARAPAAVERFNRGLRPFGFAALVRDR